MAVANVWATGHSAAAAAATVVSNSHFTPTHHHQSSPAAFAFEHSVFTAHKSVSNLSKQLINPLRNRRFSKLYCRCSSNNSAANSNNTYSSSGSGWDWNRWTRHFSEVEQAESYASVLKFQLEEAIENQDFEEAAKLKAAIGEATSMDSIADIMSQLKNAIDEERYHDASQLCKNTGSGLVGWWVGNGKDAVDPFGKLIRITPGVGRFVGKSYSPRQLVTASPGTPLFEIFVVKDDENYSMQVVFLQRSRGSTANSNQSNPKPVKRPSAEVDNASVIDVKVSKEKEEKSDEKGIKFEVATEEGIKSVINFLKDKIPELKVKVLKVNVTEEVINDNDALKQLMEEEDADISSKNSEDEASNLDDIPPDQVALGGGTDEEEDGKNLDTKLFIGGVLHNTEDNVSKDEYIRVPAGIKDVKRDSFVLHIPMREQDHDAEENMVSKVKVASLAAQGVSELMPPEVAKAFWSSNKVPVKVSKDVREILKLAVSLAQKRDRLCEYTSFSRIITTQNDLDPFEGLYVGAFGPYGTEVVQLRRKVGNWNVVDDSDKSSDVEFFEYVEAVKLTGDLNVPAGQVTFRAKIGIGNRLRNQGMYPDELGVVASYKGQGRIAEFGFKNPKWVEGELLQLNGKGMGPYVRGADLGFLYVVPEQSFLVLFNRLKLPE